jgi:hypothetical protein
MDGDVVPKDEALPVEEAQAWLDVASSLCLQGNALG